MAQAAHTLEHLSQDPEAARLAREREDSAKFYQIGIAMSREEGRQVGIAEGRQVGIAEGLRQSIRQLCGAFGLELTPERETRLTGDVDDLRRILDHIARHRAWPDT